MAFNQPTAWQLFLKENRGKGFNIGQLSSMYRNKVLETDNIKIRKPFHSHCKKLPEGECVNKSECKWYQGYVRKTRTKSGRPKPVPGHCRGDHLSLLHHYKQKHSANELDYPIDNQYGYQYYNSPEYTSKTRIPLTKTSTLLRPDSFHPSVYDTDDTASVSDIDLEPNVQQITEDDEQTETESEFEPSNPNVGYQSQQQRGTFLNPKQPGDTKYTSKSKFKQKDADKLKKSKSKKAREARYGSDKPKQERVRKPQGLQQQTQQQRQQQRQQL